MGRLAPAHHGGRRLYWWAGARRPWVYGARSLVPPNGESLDQPPGITQGYLGVRYSREPYSNTLAGEAAEAPPACATRRAGRVAEQIVKELKRLSGKSELRSPLPPGEG